MHPAKCKTYTADFKLMIIIEVYKGASKYALAVKYNLPSPGTIVLWMKKYDELGYNGLERKKGRPIKMTSKNSHVSKKQNDKLESNERLQFEQLKQENEQLKMENNLLKKLNALFQQREKQQRKKK